ncbi:hypothetical protein SLA2020_180000 [Shorea laevis]
MTIFWDFSYREWKIGTSYGHIPKGQFLQQAFWVGMDYGAKLQHVPEAHLVCFRQPHLWTSSIKLLEKDSHAFLAAATPLLPTPIATANLNPTRKTLGALR